MGNNLGTQCVALQAGALAGKGQGTVEAPANATRMKMKLVVRSGKLEVYKNDRKRGTMDYKPKEFGSGQVGFAWGGKASASVSYLKIKERLDVKKTAEMLRKLKLS
jgi:hypothetical protein